MTRRLAGIAALSLCQYLSWYFSPSTQHDGVHNHRPKLFNSNWTQLKHVLDLIIQLAREGSSGEVRAELLSGKASVFS
ncbi:BQ5605_C058g12698 [Microbotryum silenes-dioicae]|uniref:BQ5605_C058g12698 protein n=1 Tax=Microbotryum silenes-dioicae TaxID=796604 RepID=A0A2X0PGX9_9BASI|nr:BQ5605_C058g12698 [Microbotryum silenes-dioicae]